MRMKENEANLKNIKNLDIKEIEKIYAKEMMN